MKEGRLALRIPIVLLKETRALARRRKTTMSAIILKALEEMVEADRKARGVTHTIDAEQV